jgi:hypothetical protein
MKKEYKINIEKIISFFRENIDLANIVFENNFYRKEAFEGFKFLKFFVSEKENKLRFLFLNDNLFIEKTYFKSFYIELGEYIIYGTYDSFIEAIPENLPPEPTEIEEKEFIKLLKNFLKYVEENLEEKKYEK